MPLVMFSRLLIVTSRHCGYCGSHRPSVSLIESRCCASSLSSSTDVNALVLLPICQRLFSGTGCVPPKRVVPAPGNTHAQRGGRDVLRLPAGLQVGLEITVQLGGQAGAAVAGGRATGRLEIRGLR